MLGLRFAQRVLKHLSFARRQRDMQLSVNLRLPKLVLLGSLTVWALEAASSRPVFSQSALDPVAELIRTQLEVRKPPPEPILAPADVTPPSSFDTNANPVDDAAPEGSDAPPSQPPVVTAPPAKPVKFIPPKLYVGKDVLRAAALLTRFYEGRGYQPAWTTEAGPLPLVETFLATLQEEAGREGLRASDYHLAKIKAVLADIVPGSAVPTRLADLELLLTDAFFGYSADVSLGQVNLEALDEKWFSKNDEADLASLLTAAISTNHMADTMRALPPKQTEYLRLRDALARYRDLAAHGGWPTVPAGPALALDASGERVAKLRARLVASGDLPSLVGTSTDSLFDAPGKRGTEPPSSALFDQALEQAVKRFQRRHGLEENGVVGKETLAALNVSAETRARQIAINMRRWRQLPHDLGHRYIAVNVPDFTLEVVENQQRVMEMKVVVGKMIAENATPTFSAKMTYVVLNPYWYVPKTIAEKELWPLHQRNPSYFGRNKFDVRRIPVGYKQVPDPDATDGSTKSVRVYDYVIRQGPGPKNALGRVKFMFPNPYSVYLHDTPSKSLFNRTVRAFSHGCIRVEKPIELAEYLLRDSPKWPKKAIEATLRRTKEQTVYLDEPLPVYIQYWTAWMDDDGEMQFRNDIYRYDRLGPALPSNRNRKVSQPWQPPRTKIRKRRPRVEPPVQPTVPVPEQASAG